MVVTLSRSVLQAKLLATEPLVDVVEAPNDKISERINLAIQKVTVTRLLGMIFQIAALK